MPFGANGGTGGGNVTVTRNQPWNTLTIPTTNPPAGGWTLNGWFSVSAWTGGVQLPTTGNIVDASPAGFHARWQRNMQFRGNGSAALPATPDVTNTNTILGMPWTSIPRPTVSRYAYLPQGWFSAAAATGGVPIPTAGNLAATDYGVWHMRWERNPLFWQMVTFMGDGQIHWPGLSIPGGQIPTGHTLSVHDPLSQVRELLRSGNFGQAINGNGGLGVAPVVVPEFYLIAYPTTVREDFVFHGWWSAQDGGTAITATTPVNPPNVRDRTVWAQWRPGGQPFYPHWFADQNFAQAVAERFGRNWYDNVTGPALNALTGTIHANNGGSLPGTVSNLQGVSVLHNINALHLNSNQISDLAPLSGLASHGNLRTLLLNSNQIPSAPNALLPLQNLTSLETLFLGWNEITSIAPLANLVNLRELQVSNNRTAATPGISDISVVTNMPHLHTLLAAANSIENLSPLQNRMALRTVNLNDNRIADLAPLTNLLLVTLQLSDNRIVDVGPIGTISNLNLLLIARNHIFDISPLAALWNVSIIDATGQMIRLEDAIERTDIVEIPNIVVGIAGGPVPPHLFNPADGVYLPPHIRWEGVPFGMLEVSYSWTTPIAGLSASTFSGTVIQPLVEWVNVILRGNGGAPEQQMRRGAVGRPYSDVFDAADPVIRDGYTFIGWYTNYIGGERVLPTDLIPLHPWPTRTLFARWAPIDGGEPTEQVITFRGNGGTPSIQTRTAEIGDTYAAAMASVTVTRPGHTFLGWFTSDTGGEEVEPGDTVTDASARVLFAQWRLDTGADPHQRVIFRGNGGFMAFQTASVPFGVYYQEAFEQIEQPTRAGYTFMGWYTTASGAAGFRVNADDIVTSQATRTLWARWRYDGISDRNQVITFFGNGGGPAIQQAAAVIGGTYANAFNSVFEPTWSQGEFIGWFTEPVGGVRVLPGDTVTAFSTRYLFAQWDGDMTGIQTVRFRGNGGGPALQIATVSIADTTYQAAFDMVEEPTRAGYVFLGWFNQRVGGYEVLGSHSITSGRVRTLFAQWEPCDEWTGDRTQVVTFYGNGAAAPYDFRQGLAVIGGTYEALFNAMSDPTRDGYVFLGWYTDVFGGHRVLASDYVTDAPTRAFFARWQFVPTGGEPMQRITFRGNGGGPAVQTAVTTILDTTYAAAFGQVETPTRQYFAFIGWFTAPEGGVQVLPHHEVFFVENITLWAQWRPDGAPRQVQTVTFRANGGGPDWQTASIFVGEHYDPAAFAQIEEPTRRHYIFTGWWTAPVYGERVTDTWVAGNEAARTFYAQWEEDPDDPPGPRHRIEFDGRNGWPSWQVAYSPVNELFGHSFAQIQNPPLRPGWNFDGWWTTPREGGQEVFATTAISTFLLPTYPGTITLYARWVYDGEGGHPKAITFYGNGTTAFPATPLHQVVFVERFTDALYEEALNQVVDPVRPHYRFVGWYTAPVGGVRITPDMPVNDDYTYRIVYARWVECEDNPVIQTINYWAIGATPMHQVDTANTNEVYGDSFARITLPVMEDHFFMGWFSEPLGGVRVWPDDPVTRESARNLWARWFPDGPWGDEQEVIFYGNGGSPFRQRAIVYENMPYRWAFEQVNEPTRANHIFRGWFTNPVGGDEVLEDDLVTAAPRRTLFAQWDACPDNPPYPPEQTVIFRGNGGTPDWQFAVVEQGAVYGAAFSQVMTPTHVEPGFVFLGWFTGISGGMEITADDIVTNASVRTLFAQWEWEGDNNPFQTVTFHANGGGPTPQFGVVLQGAAYQAAFDQVEEPTRRHFVFRGWFTNPVGGNQVFGDTVVNAAPARDLFAQWDVCPYYPPYPPVQTVTFRGNGGHPDFQSATAVIGSAYGAAFAQVEEPTRANFVFRGWYTDPFGGLRVTAATVVNESSARTLFAQWDECPDNPPYPPVQTITFRGNGGSPDVQTATAVIGTPYGNAFAQVNEPTRDNHEFLGWFTGVEIGDRVRADDIVTDASYRVLYARWRWNGEGTPEQVITFRGNGGFPDEQTRVVQRTAGATHAEVFACVETPETALGHTFLGWFTLPVGGVEVTADTLISNAPIRTLYAQWDIDPTTDLLIIFQGNEGAPTPQSALVQVGDTFGDARALVLEPTRRAYVFNGWWTLPLGGTEVLDAEVLAATANGTRTVFARWEPCGEWDGQSILFSGNQGTPEYQWVYIEFDQTYGDAFDEAIEPWRAGYVFAGWWTHHIRDLGVEVGRDMPISSAPFRVLYAQWDPCFAHWITLTFYGAGGTPIVQTLAVEPGSEYGGAFTQVPVTREPHHAFVGWFTYPQGEGSITPREVMDDEIVDADSPRTLWAHWELRDPTTAPTMQTVHFMGNGGSPFYQAAVITPVVDGETTYYAAFNAVTVLHAHGSRFVGWFTAPDGGEQVFPGDFVTEDEHRILYARWDGDDVQWVIFRGNGGAPDEQIVPVFAGNLYETAFNQVAVPTRAGWAFRGWFDCWTRAGVQVRGTDEITDELGIVLFAHWGRTGPDIYIDVDEDGNTTVSVPPGMEYDYRWEDGEIVVTFPPGDENIWVDVPDDWTYIIHPPDADGYRVVTITPPPNFPPLCDGNCGIYIVLEEDERVSVTVPPCVDWYRVGSDDDDNITVTFPEGTCEERITVTLIPPGWGYRTHIDEDGSLVVTLIRPGDPIEIIFWANDGTARHEIIFVPSGADVNFGYIIDNRAPNFTWPGSGLRFDFWSFGHTAGSLPVDRTLPVIGADGGYYALWAHWTEDCDPCDYCPGCGECLECSECKCCDDCGKYPCECCPCDDLCPECGECLECGACKCCELCGNYPCDCDRNILVVFASNDGTNRFATIRAAYGEQFANVIARAQAEHGNPIFVRDGYELFSWSLEMPQGSPAVTGTVTGPTESLFAMWRPVEPGDGRTLTFNANDPGRFRSGSLTREVTLSVTDSLALAMAEATAAMNPASRDGYTLRPMWMRDAADGGVIDPRTLAGDLDVDVLYAYWTAANDDETRQVVIFVTYEGTLPNGGGTEAEFRYVTRGATYAPAFTYRNLGEGPAAPTGRVFLGWFCMENPNLVVRAVSTVTDAPYRELVARFGNDDGSIYVIVDEDGEITVIGYPEGEYEIGTDEDGNPTVTFPSNPDADDITVILPDDDWGYDIDDDGPDTVVTITPPGDGGGATHRAITYVNFPSSPEIAQTLDVALGAAYGDGAADLPSGWLAAPGPNYVFVGWFEFPNGQGQNLTRTAVTMRTPQTVFAHWTLVDLTVETRAITYVNFPSSPYRETIDVAFGTTYYDGAADLPSGWLTAPGPNYQFAGWFSQPNGYGIPLDDLPVGANTPQTAFAHWTLIDEDVMSRAITYVNFPNAPDDIAHTLTVDFGTTYAAGAATAPGLPAGWLTVPGDGYVFAGWFSQPNGGGIPLDSVAVGAATPETAFAHWAFEPGDGGPIRVEVDDDGNVTVTVPPGIDYEVDWDDDGNIIVTFPPGTDPDDIEVILPEVEDGEDEWTYEIVVDEDGVHVIITPPSGWEPCDESDEITIDLERDENGDYTLRVQTPPGVSYEVENKDDGRIHVIFPPGTEDDYRITVNVPDDWTYDAFPGEDGSWIVELRPPAMHTFRLVAEDGTPIPGVTVTVFCDDTDAVVMTARQTNAAGEVGIPQLPNGDYRMTATYPDHIFGNIVVYFTVTDGVLTVTSIVPVSAAALTAGIVPSSVTIIPMPWQQLVTFNPNEGVFTGPTQSPQRLVTRTGRTYDQAFNALGHLMNDTLNRPTRDGYEFRGWYDAANGGSRVNYDDAVTAAQSRTLFAQWTAVEPGGDGGITVEVDDDGNVTVTVPPGIDYEVDWDDDGNIIVTFPPGTDPDDIEVILPEVEDGEDEWTYEIIEDEDGTHVIITPPPGWEPCDENDEIVIDLERDADGGYTLSIATPPGVNYEVENKDDGRIQVIFPPGTEDDYRITVNVPDDWTYYEFPDEDGNWIVELRPPGWSPCDCIECPICDGCLDGCDGCCDRDPCDCERLAVIFLPNHGLPIPIGAVSAPVGASFEWVLENLAPTALRTGFTFTHWSDDAADGSLAIDETRLIGGGGPSFVPDSQGGAYFLWAHWVIDTARPTIPVTLRANFAHDGAADPYEEIYAYASETLAEFVDRIGQQFIHPNLDPETNWNFEYWSFAFAAGSERAEDSIHAGTQMVDLLDTLLQNIVLYSHWSEGAPADGYVMVIFLPGIEYDDPRTGVFSFPANTLFVPTVMNSGAPALSWLHVETDEAIDRWTFDGAGTEPVSGRVGDRARHIGGGIWIIEIYAQWTPVTGGTVDTVTFDANGGRWATAPHYIRTENDVAVGSELSDAAPAAPSRTGYTFVGWALTAAAAEALPGTFPITAADNHFFAVWVDDGSGGTVDTVTFDANGGRWATAPHYIRTENDVAIGSELSDIAPAAPGRTGYRFLGWALTATAAAALDDDFPISTANNHFFAVWEDENVTTNREIIFLAPGSNRGLQQFPAVVGAPFGDVFALAEDGLERTNHTLVGWSLVSGTAGVEIYDGLVVAGGNVPAGTNAIVLEAVWDSDAPDNTITFHLYDGSNDTFVIDVVPGEAVVLPDEVLAMTDAVMDGRGHALWGWFTHEQLDSSGRERNGFRRPAVGTNGFDIGTLRTAGWTLPFDTDGNFDFHAIWVLWGDVNDDDEVDHVDLAIMMAFFANVPGTELVMPAANVYTSFEADGRTPIVGHPDLARMMSFFANVPGIVLGPGTAG